MEQNKISEAVELNEEELANVVGGDGSGNSNLLWGAGGAGAMYMLKKPKIITKDVYLPSNQELLAKAGNVKKAVPILKKATSFRL